MCVVDLLKDSLELFSEVAARHGSQIRKLDFATGESDIYNHLSAIFESMPLLEDLEITTYRSTLIRAHSPDVIQVNLKHLRNLIIENEDFSIFQHFLAPNVVAVKVEGGVQGEQGRGLEKPLVNFLLNAPKLKLLSLDHRSFNAFFQTEHEIIPFKLQKFKLFWMNVDCTPNSWLNFLSFLNSQAHTLERLQLSSRPSPEVLVAFFNLLTNLKTLFIILSLLPTEEEFYKLLKPSKSLTKVRSWFGKRNRFPNENAAKGFLGNCPNLEKLEVLIEPEILAFLAINNPKLKELKVSSLTTQAQAEVRFKCLNCFHIIIVGDLELLLTFIRNNPTLTTLKTGFVEKNVFTEEVLTKLMSESNLVHLRFKGLSDTIETIMSSIAHYEKLKTLTLLIKRFPRRVWESTDFKASNDKVEIVDYYSRYH